MNSGYVSVTTSATLLNTDTSEVPGFTGGVVTVRVPSGGTTIQIGGSDVTSGTTAGTAGIPLQAGEFMSIPYGPSEGVYAIVASSTQSVYVLRQGAN